MAQQKTLATTAAPAAAWRPRCCRGRSRLPIFGYPGRPLDLHVDIWRRRRLERREERREERRVVYGLARPLAAAAAALEEGARDQLKEARDRGREGRAVARAQRGRKGRERRGLYLERRRDTAAWSAATAPDAPRRRRAAPSAAAAARRAHGALRGLRRRSSSVRIARRPAASIARPATTSPGVRLTSWCPTPERRWQTRPTRCSFRNAFSVLQGAWPALSRTH